MTEGFNPDRWQGALLSAFFLHFAGKLRSIHQSKKPFPVLERLFLMRENTHVCSGSMLEDLGGGEDGLSPLDARER